MDSQEKASQEKDSQEKDFIDIRDRVAAVLKQHQIRSWAELEGVPFDSISLTTVRGEYGTDVKGVILLAGDRFALLSAYPGYEAGEHELVLDDDNDLLNNLAWLSKLPMVPSDLAAAYQALGQHDLKWRQQRAQAIKAAERRYIYEELKQEFEGKS
ncbi:MAG: hypothetical protein AAF152_20470 [Cyanobacteria bacterium P01_A01_bin.114]